MDFLGFMRLALSILLSPLVDGCARRLSCEQFFCDCGQQLRRRASGSKLGDQGGGVCHSAASRNARSSVTALLRSCSASAGSFAS